MMAIPMEQIPAMKPPIGVMPNFENPYSAAHVVVITAAIALPLMLIMITLRIYVRLWVKKAWAREDTACIIAVLCTITQCAIILSLLNDPLGPHQWNVRLIDLTPDISKKSIGSTVTNSLAAFFTKLSFFLLYFRIFGPNRQARLLLYLGIVFIAVCYGVTIIGLCALCIPRPADIGGWISPSVATRCSRPVVQLQIFTGTISVLSDFYVLAVPIPVILKMNLPTAKKLKIGAIFATGLLACLCSVWSLVYRVKFLSNLDITWNSIPMYSLTIAELSIGIMCSCFPVLAPIFQSDSKTNPFSSLLSLFRSRAASSKNTSYPSSSSPSSANPKRRKWLPLVNVIAKPSNPSVESEYAGRLASNSSAPSSRGVNGENLTVGGLKGTGTFLGSRADEFAEPGAIRAEHEEWRHNHVGVGS